MVVVLLMLILLAARVKLVLISNVDGADDNGKGCDMAVVVGTEHLLEEFRWWQQ